ncbi:unnamed protein product [Adineta ricciae]|uniref:Uncharacterized protein n=1 Tax=Adineta ricciae TaxID=249248 RepID=A0A815SKA9_ADIRI|nr:unnamed protein product [Adineta ricciae]CAF1491222.1 unnamed protein product [Adineta ricciae]
MNFKIYLQWIYKKISNYNLFIVEENDYDDNNIKDPTVLLKHQKYKTRLYVLLLMVCLYLLFYVSLLNVKSKTILISGVTLKTFNELYSEYNQTLSCPCRISTIPYKNFVFINVTIHPVCSSIFIDSQWMDRLYLENASLYGVWDFRTTAYYQFQLLSTLCSFAKDNIVQIQNDINNTDFVSIEVIYETEVHRQVKDLVDFRKNQLFHQAMSFLNYWKTISQEHYLVSALGTNWIVQIVDIFAPEFVIGGMNVQTYTKAGKSRPCSKVNSLIPATIAPPSKVPIRFERRSEMERMPNSEFIKGFFAGCTPLEALLESTLDCIYDHKCIQLLLHAFPKLNQLNISWSDSILPTKNENISINNYFKALFITNWSLNTDYPTYFHQCSPSTCTYTMKDQRNLSYTITLLISLYGGVIIILRFVASCTIDLFIKLKSYSDKSIRNSNEQRRNMFEPVQFIKELNLFKNIHDRTENSIRQQRITTRVYLILLFGSICALCLFASLSSTTTIVIELKPSLSTFQSLDVKYSTELQCPCSKQAIPHRSFISFFPILHQICRSIFVLDDWITMLKYLAHWAANTSWNILAYTQFAILSGLCQQANETINDAIDQYLLQFFIASSALNETNFYLQLNTSLTQLYQSTFYNFDLLKDVVHLIMQIDQPYVGGITWPLDRPKSGLMLHTVVNETNGHTFQVQFILNGIKEMSSKRFICVCAINPNCADIAHIYHSTRMGNITNDIYNISGWMQGCFTFDSLLLSTLQLVYMNSDDFLNFMSHIQLGETRFHNVSSSLRPQPLFYDPKTSHYPPNTSISTIIKKLMIEQWNPSLSYEQFYKSCAPNYCSYPERTRNNDFIGVIIILISMMSSIVIVLKLLTPHLVQVIFKLHARCSKTTRQTEPVHRSILDRLKTWIRNLIKLLRATLVTLNIFPLRDFGSYIDRETAKRCGRWATRLYILLLIASHTILIFYTIVQPRPSRTTYLKPDLFYYNRLRKIYGDQLKCSCSQIASTYDRFVKIETIFHSVCRSNFVSEEWRLDLVNGLVPNFTLFNRRDYRRFLPAHLYYLQKLCNISEQSVQHSINEFLTSLLITVELLPKNQFDIHLNTTIEQSKSSAPILVSRLLPFIQSLSHGNALISTYETNFEYVLPANKIYNSYLPTQGIVYDDQCSCGKSPTCTTQAVFIEGNRVRNFSVHGMKMGCTPSESFLASTLQCFYNQSCLDLIQTHTNHNFSITPLQMSNSSFSQNTTIDELKRNLFIENWSTDVNYSSYYEQCSPSICFYISVERFNILSIIAAVLGLQGGLSIVLKWICPKLIRIGFWMYNKRKNPANSISTTDSVPDSSHVNSNSDENKTTPTNSIYHRSFIKVTFTIILLLCISGGFLLFSVQYIRRESLPTASIDNSSNSTIMPMSSTTSGDYNTYHLLIFSISLLSEPICLPKFNRLSMNVLCQGPLRDLAIVVDVNNDSRVDLILLCTESDTINVLLSNGDGTFQTPIVYLFELFGVVDIHVGDINNDTRPDLVLVYETSALNIVSIFGNGNGTFQTQHRQSISTNHRIFHIILADLNQDNQLDIILTSDGEYIYIYFGDGTGNFSLQSELFVRRRIIFGKILLAKFNGDNYLDIAVMDHHSAFMYVFFGSNQGSFHLHQWFFTSVNVEHSCIVHGNFLGDNQSDIVFLRSWTNTISMSYRYSNGSFRVREQIVLESELGCGSAVVSDLNGDNYLDIVVTRYFPYMIYGFLGDGNGNFRAHTIFTHTIYLNEFDGVAFWIDVKDFNNDNCQDIISMTERLKTIDIFLNTCHCFT